MTKRYAIFLRCKGAGVGCSLAPLADSHRRETFTTRESAEARLDHWHGKYPNSTYYVHEVDGD